jgi:hypothetical protein
MAKLYANENFPLPAVEQLRAAGHDVETVAETGRAEQSWPDEDVLKHACDNERALLTINRKHFLRLHRDKPDHQGIIVCTYDPDFARQASRIHDAITIETKLAGKLIRVNRPAN